MCNVKKGGSEFIQKMIDAAVENGTRKAVVYGDWEIEKAVRIPSDFELILDGCHLVMADNVYDNMFINENNFTDLCYTAEGVNKNIKVTGINHPILDGGNYNGLSEATHNKNGLPHIYKNITFYFHNVEGFEVSGLHFHNFRYWALNFEFCRFGKIHDIHFKANLECEFEGVKFNYFRLDRYNSMIVRQADGLDIRQGCHDILVENIHGVSGDDSVALTNLPVESRAVKGLSTDMYNITVKHVRTATLDANVRILGQGGGVIHDVLVEDVYDMSAQLHGISFGMYGVKLNEIRAYKIGHATPEQMYNITIRNIHSRACYCVFYGGYTLNNLVIEDLHPFDGAGLIQDYREIVLQKEREAKEKEQAENK